MLQIEHIYKFFYQGIFKDFDCVHLPDGVAIEGPVSELSLDCLTEIENSYDNKFKILFYDQEPLLENISDNYINIFRFPTGHSVEELLQIQLHNKELGLWHNAPDPEIHLLNLADPNRLYKEPNIIATSEKSQTINSYLEKYNMKGLYYFFHGFAALDWFRGFHALNYTKDIVKDYKYNFVSFNRIVTGDRAYRQTFVEQLRKKNLLDQGAVSYGVSTNPSDNPVNEYKLIIDNDQIPGSASADIADVDAFWHIVTETIFYYDKLHLTEKIFKPIVSKQPFMLLAAPGNLEYLRSYGFKTFTGIIDESYDSIKNNDDRINAVVSQIKWYCDLSESEKIEVQRKCKPIIEHNFHHFYGKFKEIITDELLDNTKKLFKDIEYDDSEIDYSTTRKLLTS